MHREMASKVAPYILRRTADILTKHLPPLTQLVVFCRPSVVQVGRPTREPSERCRSERQAEHLAPALSVHACIWIWICIPIPLHLPPSQLELYTHLLRQSSACFSGSSADTGASLAIITALRKLCNSPSILLRQRDKAPPPTDGSGASGSRLDAWLEGIAPQLEDAASTSAVIEASGTRSPCMPLASRV